MINKFKTDHFILLFTLIITFISIYISWKSPFARAIQSNGRINGLIIGTDWVDYARHSDTLIFANYDTATRILNIISIPRDTRFTPAGYHFNKINEVYAYHFRKSKNDDFACKQVILAVEELFMNKIKIPYYIRVDYSSFRKLIDLIGGVTIDIDEPMHYDDIRGNLHIHLEPGKQHLDGYKALEYVRFRGIAGDMGRIYRQQRFLKSVLAQWNNPSLLFRLPHIAYVAASEINTNISLWDLLIAALEIKDLKLSNIRLAQLPGTPKKLYWEVDYENSLGLIDKIIQSPYTPTTLNNPKVRVEVWNASGKSKLAEKVTWILRKQGFDVIDWGSFSVIQKKTIIKDLSGDMEPAVRISDILKCGEIVTRYNAKRTVDVSIILGEDYELKEENDK